jgi:hypothetical protein
MLDKGIRIPSASYRGGFLQNELISESSIKSMPSSFPAAAIPKFMIAAECRAAHTADIA